MRVTIRVREVMFNKDRLLWLRWAGPDCTVTVFSDDWARPVLVVGGRV